MRRTSRNPPARGMRRGHGSARLRAMRTSHLALRCLAVFVLVAAMVSFAAGECRAAAPPPEGVARIHYHRPDGAYAGWGLHVWENTTATVTWPAPLAQTGRDDFGVVLGRAAGRERGEGRLHRSQGRRQGSRPRHVVGPGRAGSRGVDRLRSAPRSSPRLPT